MLKPLFIKKKAVSENTSRDKESDDDIDFAE
jgi:hypothetical protein